MDSETIAVLGFTVCGPMEYAKRCVSFLVNNSVVAMLLAAKKNNLKK